MVGPSIWRPILRHLMNCLTLAPFIRHPTEKSSRVACASALTPFPLEIPELEPLALRFFQQSSTLRVAAADLTEAIPPNRMSDCLTNIAEVCLHKVLELAWRDLIGRHGTPMVTGPDGEHSARFGIVAYGKLGGFELSYGSDLDLVFLHGSKGPGKSRMANVQLTTRSFSRDSVNGLSTTSVPIPLPVRSTRLIRVCARTGRLTTGERDFGVRAISD